MKSNSKNATPFSDPRVAKVFKAYPPQLREALLQLREMIFAVAATTPGVGRIEEVLRWNEPAYLTTQTKSGSTIRVNRISKSDTQYGMYFICNTNLVDTFRTLFPEDFVFSANRCLIFDIKNKIPRSALRLCIAMALTYHLKKKANQ